VGDCFIYTNSTNRLNYLVGDQTYTISHFDNPMYLLGYIQRDSRIYLADKDVTVVSFALSLSLVEYQTLVLRGDMDTAAELLPTIPEDQLNKIARFLEGQNHKDLALTVATDPEHKFDLALALNELPIALSLAREADVEHKWKTVGDAALVAWDVSLASECFLNAKDLGSLLLLYTSTGNAEGLKDLAAKAQDAGSHNVAFSCLWQTGDVKACIDLLTETGRNAEAVLFAQTYMPSLAPETVAKWKAALESEKKARVARVIGVPGAEGDEELFPAWDEWLRLETEGVAVTADGEAAVDEAEEEEEAGEADETLEDAPAEAGAEDDVE
jgi:coatomer subunit beta'